MAALFWLALIVADGLLAVLGTQAMVARAKVPAWAGSAWAVAAFLILPWGLISISVLLTARTGDSQPRALLRALLTEPWYAALVIGRMVLEPWRGSPKSEVPDAGPVRPVLLLHGILCNRGIWRGWLQELRDAGFAPVRSLDFEPLLGDFDTHTARVTRALTALQGESHGTRIDVIAHSMGGLIARAALPVVGPQTIRRIVTLGCPHHGTRVAGHYPAVPARLMRLDSSWLARLNASQEEHWTVPVTSIYSLEDNLIVPASSARLAGADCQVLRGIGHLGLLCSHAVRRRALAALGDA